MFILLKMSQYKSEEEVNLLYLAQNIRFTSLTDRANDFFIFSVEIISCTSKKLVWTQLFYFYHNSLVRVIDHRHSTRGLLICFRKNTENISLNWISWEDPFVFTSGQMSFHILESSIAPSARHKLAKWADVQSAESVTVMTEEVKQRRPRVPPLNCLSKWRNVENRTKKLRHLETVYKSTITPADTLNWRRH